MFENVKSYSFVQYANLLEKISIILLYYIIEKSNEQVYKVSTLILTLLKISIIIILDMMYKTKQVI